MSTGNLPSQPARASRRRSSRSTKATGESNNQVEHTKDANTDMTEVHEGEMLEEGNGIKITSLAVSKSSAAKPAKSAQPESALHVAGVLTIAGGERPVTTSTMQVIGTFEAAGTRPVSASDLQIYETINEAGIRPITASDLKTVELFDSSGQRPITADTFEICGTFNSSGIRPVGASPIHFSDAEIIGNRPVGVNDDQSAGTLMGYID